MPTVGIYGKILLLTISRFKKIYFDNNHYMLKRGNSDVPLFRTNAGTRPKKELQQWNLSLWWCTIRNCEETAVETPPPLKTAICRRICLFVISRRIRFIIIIWDQLILKKIQLPLINFCLSSNIFKISQVNIQK